MKSLLQIENLQAAYGRSQVLFGVNLEVYSGTVVSLLGRNGMGKTTTIRSLLGITQASAGKVRFSGQEVQQWPAYRISRLGIGLVPEGRQIFPLLTVRENLLATAANRHNLNSAWDLKKVYDLFPILRDRRDQLGNSLSGGEQQMLAIGRALMTNPKLLILDEATEGLAPLIRDEIWGVLESLKEQGQSILLIDKNLEQLMRLVDQHFLMERGRIVWEGMSKELRKNPELIRRYLGV
ncbi:MAG TPA: ABC transporter ATP-binding protein [Deltaproteobacteria bacterium]|jgi:branched-chain amino acid transport system ATP-binding protein|nr:ABC transporter ATP-binding protein [Deltaproteobacteria bacterium]|tara:strand:- start:2073 stop:2783 length:711 start_codon:yes stop_codon:yes gene_type:complete